MLVEIKDIEHHNSYGRCRRLLELFKRGWKVDGEEEINWFLPAALKILLENY